MGFCCWYEEINVSRGELDFMKKDMVKILCCPTCKGDLELDIKKEDKGEIIEGSFTCKTCNCNYSIEDGIPNLLPK